MATASNLRSDRIEVRTSPDEKALLVQAAAIERLDLTSFIMRALMPHAEQVVANATRIELSPRDTLKILDLLENPPPPPERLVEAARRRIPKE